MAREISSQDNLGQQQVGAPAARWIVLVLGLAFIGVAVVAGRDIWARYTGNAEEWGPYVTNAVGNFEYQQWMLYAGVAACVVALLLLIAVFKPRPKTHIQLVDGNQSVWMRPVDVARMCSAAASALPGVQNATTTVKPRVITVNVAADASDSTLVDRVGRTVSPLVKTLAGSPELKIAITNTQEAQS